MKLAPDSDLPASGTGETAEHVRALRLVLNILAASVIVLSTSFFLYLYREVRAVNRQSAQMQAIVAEYQQNALPVLTAFQDRLFEFADQHPDFHPILARYFGTNRPALPSSPIVPAPATAFPPPE